MTPIPCLLYSVLVLLLLLQICTSYNTEDGPIPAPRIIGGSDTDPSKHRWFATMGRPIMDWEKQQQFRTNGTLNEKATMKWSGCSGTLIAPRWIITAAHCLWSKNATELIFRVGFRGFCREHPEANCGLPFEERRGQYLRYWRRNKDKEGAFVDVGLVKLDNASTLDPVLLDYDGNYSTTLQVGDKMKALGTGKTTIRGNDQLPEVLQEATVGFIEDEHCHERLNTGGTHDDGFLCSAQLDVKYSDRSRTCFGDSGGPLVIERLINGVQTEVQVGVISAGDPLCFGSSAGYAEVSYAADFICWTICGPDNPDAAEDCPDWCGTVTAMPSAADSAAPSSLPSISSPPSISPEPSVSPTVASCNPSPILDFSTNRTITFIFPSMGPATDIVQLRTFIRGDFNTEKEYADFYWLNGTSKEFIGRNNGGGNADCSEDFLDRSFIIAPDTYNAWIQANTTIQILLVASPDVNPALCPNAPYPIHYEFNDAYIQFNIDEACGAIPSQAPSMSPSALASASPSISAVPSISLAPTASPSISSAPSLSIVPSSPPTAMSCQPSPIIEFPANRRTITFTFPSMAPSISNVQLRTFLRGDYKHSTELAVFYWLNGTTREFIGTNNGGEDCGDDFLEQAFIIEPDTYNAWVQTNTAIQILLVASPGVGPSLCPDNNDAYIQFNIDEACGRVDSQALSAEGNSNDGGLEGENGRDRFLRRRMN